MSAIETASSEPAPPGPQTSRPNTAEVTGWLLEGRWFTIDLAGKITSWSPAAAARFGYERKDIAGSEFAETLVDPACRAACEEAVAAAVAGGTSDQAGFTGEIDAVDSSGGALRAAFALVPIQLSVGYEFNALLQEISSHSSDSSSVGQLKQRHESVITLIESALSGKAAEAATTDEGGRLAGALVVFRAAEAQAAPAAPDNVVSIADAAGAEEVRSQLDRSRQELEEARTEIRSLEGQLEEARREAQRSRNEVDVARQEAGDARDTLAVAQREASEAKRQIDDARRVAEEARSAAEDGRMRYEEATREADKLRAELRDARDAARGASAQTDDELAEARREAAAALGEAARHEAEAEGLRERLLEARRELGELRAEVEATRAELSQGSALAERRGSEAERLRAELDQTRAEAERLTGELNRQAAESGDTVAQLERARAELEAARTFESTAPSDAEHARLRAVFHGAPVATALVGTDGRLVEANAALCELLGHPRDQLVATDPPALVHPDDLDAKLALTARMLAGATPNARGLRRYLHADGHAITTRESLALVRDADGAGELFVLQLEEVEGDEPDDAVVVDADVAGEELDAPSEGALRAALEDELFQLHGQPVLDLRTNEIAQYELLIRMVGEDGRLILPQAFLGPARRAGLAHAIDRWVVRQAIGLLARSPENVRLEVNLSPEAIHDPDLATLIDQELTSTPIDPGRLILEVTGQTAAEDLDATCTLAKRIRALGCRFALDDFRSTFGSFRLLKDLPLDYLKLDGELVGSLSESRTSQLIVKALVEVASGTGASTVAVFVSDDNTLAVLRQQGVDYAQGYKVGRPRPVEEIWAPADPPALPAGS